MKLKLMIALIACANALPALAAGYIDSAEKVAQIRAGTTTPKDLEGMFGAPLRKLRFGQREVWEYEAPEASRRVVISISIEGGVVRSVQRVSAGGV